MTWLQGWVVGGVGGRGVVDKRGPAMRRRWGGTDGGGEKERSRRAACVEEEERRICEAGNKTKRTVGNGKCFSCGGKGNRGGYFLYGVDTDTGSGSLAFLSCHTFLFWCLQQEWNAIVCEHFSVSVRAGVSDGGEAESRWFVFVVKSTLFIPSLCIIIRLWSDSLMHQMVSQI